MVGDDFNSYTFLLRADSLLQPGDALGLERFAQLNGLLNRRLLKSGAQLKPAPSSRCA